MVVRWRIYALDAQSCGTLQVQAPSAQLLFIYAIIYLVLYEFDLLSYLLVLSTGQLPMETEGIR